jgi:hypothetical protein
MGKRKSNRHHQASWHLRTSTHQHREWKRVWQYSPLKWPMLVMHEPMNTYVKISVYCVSGSSARELQQNPRTCYNDTSKA